ncbi:LruC domain-containing protein [Vibrio maritimus]
MKGLALGVGLVSCAVTSAWSTEYHYPTGGAEIGYSLKGKPDATVNVGDSLPTDLLERIDSMLPPGQKVNPDYIATDAKSNIEIDPEFAGTAYVSFTFLNEGASFNNVFGYFVFDTDTPPTTRSEVAQHQVVFPNASKPPAGEMLQGDQLTYQIPLQAGQSLGFFVVPNGWGWDWLGEYGKVPYDGPWRQPFYSLSALNPERSEAERYHNVVFVDEENEFLVIGFEDTLYSSGDKDFNDLLFSVNVTPFAALDGIDDASDSQYIPLAASENSQQDESTTTYYPTASTYATLAFEDHWPYVGDFDYNDVVVRYQMTLQKTPSNELKSLELDATIQSLGADYHNALAWRIPNLGSDNIETVTLTLNNTPVSHNIVQMDGEDALFILSEDLHQDVNTSCGFFRSKRNCRESENTQFQLSVTLKQPVAESATGLVPFDPFIFAAKDTYHGTLGYDSHPGSRWQVHLKDYCGTSDFDTLLLNTHDDDSKASYCFLDNNNIPWAINIADDWDHPAEKQSITDVYPLIYQWVQSNGDAHSSWYKRSNANSSLLYE